MKFTKFIPVALALTLAVPAFAATTDTKNATLQFTMPQFFEIVEVSKTTAGGEATVDAGYAGLHMTQDLGASYNVTTNVKNKVFYVYAKSAVSGGTTDALVGSKGSLKILFTNTETGCEAPADVKTKWDNANGALHANTVAFPFTLTTDVPDAGITIGGTHNDVVFTVDPGTYSVAYTVTKDAVAASFTQHDNPGVYQSIVTITDVSL